MRDAIYRRVEALEISRTTLDEIAGLPSGHSGKLLAPGEAKDPKRFGMVSLGLILQATGLKLIVVDDHQTLAKVSRMCVKRDTTQVRLNNDCRRSKGHKKPKPAGKRKTKRATVKRGKPYLSKSAA